MLLEFLEGVPVRVSAAGRRLGLGKAVVHRILRSLESRQLVTFSDEDRTCRLGPAAAALGARAAHQLDLRGIAHPTLRQLARETGETAALAVPFGSFWVYRDQVESINEIHVRVELGRPLLLDTGAPGAVILAFSPAELRRQVLTESQPAGDRDSELAEAAERGVVVSLEERPGGVGTMAVPLFGTDGGVVGAVSVCGPAERFTPEAERRFFEVLRPAAETISERLGWRGAFSLGNVPA